MIVHLTLVLLVVSTTSSSLVSPFNRGIIGKVSKQFLQDFASQVADQTEADMQRRSFSGSGSGSDYSFRYWGVNVRSISLSPTISLWNDGSPRSGTGRLGVNGRISGSIRASGSWSLDKEFWFFTANFAGRVDVQSSSFSLTNRVILGEKSNGKVGFSHVPSACSANIASLSVDISGSWFSWILNLLVWYFDDELTDALEEFACEKTNAVIGEALQDYEDAMLNRDYSLPLKTGGSLEVDFTPSVITGGSTCAVIVTPAALDLSGTPRSSGAVTPPFINIPATEESDREKREAGSPNIEKRGTDWCSSVPGSSSGVSIILTEDMVTRLIQNLHHFDLLKFNLVQSGSSDNQMTFDVTRNGRKMRTFNVQLPETDGREFANFTRKTIKISSTAVPDVHLSSSGISVRVNLRARVTLFSDDPNLEIRTEFESKADWSGAIDLVKKGGRYSFVPRSVTATVNVWTGKLFLESQQGGQKQSGQQKLEEGNFILEAIERLLNSVLEDNLAKLLEDDVSSGIPVNIPYQYVTIGSANIAYGQDYILVTADNIGVSLD